MQKNIEQPLRTTQKGVSAIFMVIFAAMLLSLVAISFIGLMIRDQARSIDDEQSQGAYDAALAGIEDGKRVLIECEQGDSDACDAINAGECNTVEAAGLAGSSEVDVTSGSNDLNMAYTCVVISYQNEDYIGTLDDTNGGTGSAQAIVPLHSGGVAFDRVVLRWFTSGDAGGSSLTMPGGGVTLPQLSTWATDTPPLMRVQLIQYEGGNMDDADFEDSTYASTLYLMPSDVEATYNFLTNDTRSRNGTIEPLEVDCDASPDADFSFGGAYACETTVELPPLSSRVAFLRVSSFYNTGNVNFQVQLKNGVSTTVNFDGVQPSIDATGRANDLFRRIEARVQFDSEFPYPRAAVDITNNFCKTFSTGKNKLDFEAGGCDPLADHTTP